MLVECMKGQIHKTVDALSKKLECEMEGGGNSSSDFFSYYGMDRRGKNGLSRRSYGLGIAIEISTRRVTFFLLS